ncbi:MAG: hypothetical protein QNJ31_07285 [Candidatus Caenarcaniphilales bacterium]|nr:hypothetical protein [Candidatus Caenarcaniphilales bacterium]
MDLRELFKQINTSGDDKQADTTQLVGLTSREIQETEEAKETFQDEYSTEIIEPSNQPSQPHIEDINVQATEKKPVSSINNGSSLGNSLNEILNNANPIQQKAESSESSSIILSKKESFFAPPSGMHDVGLSPVAIQDLLLKCLFYQSNASGKELANRIRLPLHNVVDPMMMKLSDEKFVEVTGTAGLGGFNKIYRLTSAGYNRAQDVLRVSNYVGPAPVSLADYTKAVNEHYGDLDFSDSALKDAYKDLVINETAFDQIGPALMSGKSMFMYGPAGTGKTSIAERITRCYKSTIMVPYAINVQGIPMRFFDYFQHKPVGFEIEGGVYPPLKQDMDNRWVEIKRPCIIVGPEFNIASADLQYDPDGPSYQFPSPIKANGGVFVVDDFGRQRENPEVLLNRWIIPLDKQKDILSLRTGQQISVPFKVFTVFSTNLDPKQLVDDAFLRRLAYKIKIEYPELETYCRIFANEANKVNIQWNDELLDYFIQTYYFQTKRPLRACDPKDILSRAQDICKFKKLKSPYKLNNDLIDRACKSYFVSD